MKNVEKTKSKNILVTLILTESTSSLLKLNAPHLEHFHPQDSNICVITESDFKKFLLTQNELSTETLTAAGTSGEIGVTGKIASGLAYFSNSNNKSSSSCFSELSDDFIESNDENSEQQILFQAIKLQNLPIVSVRSKAHTDKLDMVSNDIYVTLLDTDSQSSLEYICRICHGGESLGDLLTPCRCRGTIALVHLKCLERWLKESNRNHCELCQHHYEIIREPKYSIPWSVLMFLKNPGEHFKDILLDTLAFTIYTPSAVASTYMLLMICESLVKSNVVVHGSIASHIIAFTAVFGMAAIDFTYSSWLIMCLQKHYEGWREWYNNNSDLKIVLPKIKLRPRRMRTKKETDY